MTQKKKKDYLESEVKNDPDLKTVEQVVNDFDASWEYAQGHYHKIWEDAFALYNNQRIKQGYKGITNTFVPMTFSTIETMAAALFGSKPKFEYLPPQDRPDQNTEILNALLDYYWDKDNWDIKVIKWGRGMLREGTSIVYIYWDIDHPCLLNVPIRDFFINPEATDFSNARYMGRRYLTTIDELKSFEIVDVNAEPDEEGNQPLKKKYKNLDKITESNQSGDQTDKQKKDMFYGSTVSEPEKKQVEVIEYWTLDKTISIANRSVVIEDTENYYKAQARENGSKYPKGVFPFAPLRDYTDESLFYARGEVEVIADEQELLNDITNQNIDSITYTLNQMYTLDPKYAHLLKEIENIPGAVYLAENGALQPIQQRPVPPDAFAERQNIKNEIRETTASNEIVKGVGAETKTTATEVNAQIAGAGQRLALKITQIENEGFHILAKVVFELIKRYVTEPMLVRIVGKDGIRWEEYNPEEFTGDYEPRVQLDTSIQSKKQEDAQMAKELLGAFLNDPDINQPELKKMVLAKAFELDPDEVDTLVQPAPEMGMMGDMGMSEDPMLDPSMMDASMMPPMDNVIEDPMTGELIPVGQMEPTPEDLMALDQGMIA